jgi:AbrB family looped-hinge helix DNA binding protein
VRLSTRGRVVIPIQLRRQLGLQPGTTIVVKDDGNRIVLTPQKADRAGKQETANRDGKTLALFVPAREQEGPHQFVEIAVENAVHIADFRPGSQVLDHAIWLQNVGPYL